MADTPKALSDEQFRKLRQDMMDEIEAVMSPRFDKAERQVNANTNKIETLARSVEDYGREASEDRRDIGEIKVKLASVEQRSKEIMDMLAGLGREIVDGVNHTIFKQEDRIVEKIEEKVPESVQQAATNVIEAKRTKIQRINNRKPWWKKLWR